VDYIESTRKRNLFWIDSWTKADIEARLRANPSYALRYPDIVTIIGSSEGDTSQGDGTKASPVETPAP